MELLSWSMTKKVRTKTKKHKPSAVTQSHDTPVVPPPNPWPLVGLVSGVSVLAIAGLVAWHATRGASRVPGMSSALVETTAPSFSSTRRVLFSPKLSALQEQIIVLLLFFIVVSGVVSLVGWYFRTIEIGKVISGMAPGIAPPSPLFSRDRKSKRLDDYQDLPEHLFHSEAHEALVRFVAAAIDLHDHLETDSEWTRNRVEVEDRLKFMGQEAKTIKKHVKSKEQLDKLMQEVSKMLTQPRQPPGMEGTKVELIRRHRPIAQFAKKADKSDYLSNIMVDAERHVPQKQRREAFAKLNDLAGVDKYFWMGRPSMVWRKIETGLAMVRGKAKDKRKQWEDNRDDFKV